MIKMQSRWTWNLSPTTNTSKIHLHLALKTNWKLAKSPIQPRLKERSTELGRNGREAIRSGPVAQAGVSEEKGDYRGRDSPWGVNGSSYTLQARVLRSGPVKTSSLERLEDWED